jgi:L-amino acid N-acyltransferase YncA
VAVPVQSYRLDHTLTAEQMTMAGDGLSAYPKSQYAGGVELTFRLMTPEDRARVLEFARALPQHDLMFLRRDISQEAGVDAWLAEIEIGEATTVLAVEGEHVVGYATVHRSLIPWSAHVAELRVLVSEQMRGKGLGGLLTQEAFNLAVSKGLEKMIAQMTLDQKGAISTFESLGFRPEALLRDHVKDRDGNRHDLLILSHEVQRFQAEHAEPGA